MRRLVISLCALALVAADAAGTADVPPVVTRFLSREEPPLVSVRARRHLEARNAKFKKQGWVDAVTSIDRSGFRYEVVGEGGSEYIRNKVLRKVLAGEKEVWENGEAGRAALTEANYVFAMGGEADGLVRVELRPRREDRMLVRGSVFFSRDGDLVRIEGKLAKNPSFWTRDVQVVRRYGRIDGIRVPLAIESTSRVWIAGTSTFSMTYKYEQLNGRPTSAPE